MTAGTSPSKLVSCLGPANLLLLFSQLKVGPILAKREVCVAAWVSFDFQAMPLGRLEKGVQKPVPAMIVVGPFVES